LMVMPNVGRTGNWRRRRVKGICSVSEGVMVSRGMNTRWPFAGPVATLDHGQKSSRSQGFVRGSPCACEERALDVETARACVRACVCARYCAIFFGLSPKSQALHGFAFHTTIWGHKSTGYCCGPPAGPVGGCL
jgi:hypothetical protein